MATFGGLWWFFLSMGIGLAVWRAFLSQDAEAIRESTKNLLAPPRMFYDGAAPAGVKRNHLMLVVVQRRMAFVRFGYVVLGVLTIISLVVRFVS